MAVLSILAFAAWHTPGVNRPPPGPSPDQVRIQIQDAQIADLRRQNRAMSATLAEGHPLQPDVVAEAKYADTKHQNETLIQRLMRPRAPVIDSREKARGDSLKSQLVEAQNRPPRPIVVDPTQEARANDLAHQNNILEQELSRPRPTVVPPVVPTLTKTQILQGRGLYGLYTQQSPFSYSEVDLVQSEVGRRANVVGYFQSWQDPFRPDALADTWSRGQIPLMTWEPQPQVGVVTSDVADYNLPAILSGRYDDYIRSYANGIKSLGFPIIIRLAHEMNGNWYPWSETDAEGNSINGNSRGQYAQMWRHVHDIFQAAGANDYTIWLWSPNRVNRIPRQPDPAEFYPGDDAVDWIGMSGYNRPNDDAPTFTDSFGPTLPLLRAASSTKPIFLSEIGATELGGHKADWIHSLFRGLAANPDIIGFSWFSLTVTSTAEGERQTNDWRLDSSGASIQAMKDELARSGEYGLP